jgi:hypothetical protein
MKQLEINFFWPLTEQVPLELDYSNCEKPKFHSEFLIGPSNLAFVTSNSNTKTAFHIDVDNVVVKTSKKPNIIRKMMFNVMGIKLENKQ